MNAQVLIETLTWSQSNIISESASDGKNLWLSGVFMQADIRNRNNRIYPMNEISRAVTEAQAGIKDANGIFGELDHPTTLSINLDRISHVITDLRMEGTNAVGRMKILPTPMGDIAKALIESGVRIGVSSRGAGQVNDQGIVEGFNFITVDIVATPSAQGARPESIYESLDMTQEGRKVLTLAEQMQQDESAQKYFKEEILRFLNHNMFAATKSGK